MGYGGEDGPIGSISAFKYLKLLRRVVERETGFEPATSTLARLRSTS